jgi:uncharacterized membrane protein YidH (DUF202 family)
MSPQRILGIVLLVVGVAIMVMGMNQSHSAGDQITNAVTGHYTDHTTWYIIGGIALGIVGLLMSFFGMRGKDA